MAARDQEREYFTRQRWRARFRVGALIGGVLSAGIALSASRVDACEVAAAELCDSSNAGVCEELAPQLLGGGVTEPQCEAASASVRHAVAAMPASVHADVRANALRRLVGTQPAQARVESRASLIAIR